MTPDSGMTGQFKTMLPTDLLTALQLHPIENPGKDMEVSALQPSLMERVLGLFGGASVGRR